MRVRAGAEAGEPHRGGGIRYRREAAPEAGSRGKEAGDGRHTIAYGLGNFGAIEEPWRRGDHLRNTSIVRKEKA